MNKIKELNRKVLKSFTIIELLIGLTIFSIIAVSLYSTFFSSTSVWKRSEDLNRVYQEARWSLDTMAKELHNTIVLNYKGESEDSFSFNGASDNISFLLATDTGIKRISYFLEEIKSNDDKIIFSLKRQELGFIDSLQTQNDSEQTEEIFSNLVSEGGLNFSYAFQNEIEEIIEWKDAWNESKNLPRGIKIALTLVDPRNPNSKIDFSKTIFIPTGMIGSEKE